MFRGLNLLFGRLSEEVVFSCTSEGPSARSLPQELLPGLKQMALGWSSSSRSEGWLSASAVQYLIVQENI